MPPPRRCGTNAESSRRSLFQTQLDTLAAQQRSAISLSFSRLSLVPRPRSAELRPHLDHSFIENFSSRSPPSGPPVYLIHLALSVGELWIIGLKSWASTQRWVDDGLACWSCLQPNPAAGGCCYLSALRLLWHGRVAPARSTFWWKSL